VVRTTNFRLILLVMELGPPLHSSSRPLESSPNYPSPSRSSLEAQRTPLYKAFMTRLGDSLSPSQRLRETLAQSSSLPSTSLRVIQTPSADGIWSGSVFLPQNSKAPYIPQAPKDDQVFLGRNFRLSLLASTSFASPALTAHQAMLPKFPAQARTLPPWSLPERIHSPPKFRSMRHPAPTVSSSRGRRASRTTRPPSSAPLPAPVPRASHPRLLRGRVQSRAPPCQLLRRA